MNTPKIIYIAGYGYSGSTLLERILATHPQVIACGEAYNLLEDFEMGEICACGAVVKACPFWKKSHAQYLRNNSEVDTINIFSLLSEQVSDEVLFFCDASKTTWGTMLRPYQLSKRYDVYMIHLSRNGNACLNSIIKRKGSSRATIKALITGLHWSMAHCVPYWFKIRKPSRYHRIKYEDLVEQPAVFISNLFRFLGLDPKSIGEDISYKKIIPLSHQLSGNAIRRNKNLVLRSSSISNRSIGFVTKLVFKVVSLPMQKLMGY